MSRLTPNHAGQLTFWRKLVTGLQDTGADRLLDHLADLRVERTLGTREVTEPGGRIDVTRLQALSCAWRTPLRRHPPSPVNTVPRTGAEQVHGIDVFAAVGRPF